MKILIYSDVHISQDSSIVKSLGERYSTRLEYILKGLNWAENLALKENCKYIFNLGDMFDKPSINAMEATAITDVKWAPLKHFLLVGNHDSNVASLNYSSAAVFNQCGFEIIKTPEHFVDENISFTFIPYITEDNRKPFKKYLSSENDIVLSHNDIAGFNFGGFLSKEGFDIEKIKKSCKLFLNGHLHNSAYLAKNVLNVGNLCGQNFSENAFMYKHGAWILNTDDMSLTFRENPYALNFYKIEYTDNKVFEKLKNNCVLTFKCERNDLSRLKEALDINKNKVVASHIIVYDKEVSAEVSSVKLEKVDYLKQFADFIHEKLGSTEIINEELSEVCK